MATKVKKGLWALGIAATVAHILVFAAIAFSVLTIVSVTQTMTSYPEELFEFSGGRTPSGDYNGTLTWRIRNQGFLDIFSKFKVRLLSSTGDSLAEGSDQRRITPGTNGSLSVTLAVPSSSFERVQKAELQLEIRTFFDLVGFSISVPMPLSPESLGRG